jgi:hypothetical protein
LSKQRRLALAIDGGSVARHQLHPKLAADFIQFSNCQYASLDYDPFHPMLVHLSRGLPREEALWLSTLYMAFYNIGSAYAAFKAGDPLAPLPDWALKLPVGVQRRNLRGGGKVAQHLADFSRAARQRGSIHNLLTEGFVGDVRQDWAQLKLNVGAVWGNGRWSVYTSSELYQKANGLAVWPCDIMNDGSSGPAAGLSKLYCVPIEEQEPAVLDPLADSFFNYTKRRVKTNIFYLPKGHFDYAMLESQLCDFNSLLKGRYYVGRDIDRDQERIVKAEELLRLMNQRVSLGAVWEARAAVFAKRYLGEFSGWSGRTEYAKVYYKETGRIADHKTIQEERRAWQLF